MRSKPPAAPNHLLSERVEQFSTRTGEGENEKVGKLIKIINRAAQQLLPGSRSGGAEGSCFPFVVGLRYVVKVRRADRSIIHPPVNIQQWPAMLSGLCGESFSLEIFPLELRCVVGRLRVNERWKEEKCGII